jgi:pyruvate dehydrogenase E1 component
MSTQEGFGVLLRALAERSEPAPYLVTAAPDVATATGLSGFIDRAGSYQARQCDADEADTMPQWRCSPRGQHIELGVSEMNLFSLLGQLGLAWDLSDQPLLPVGTVYDPFLCRGLDGLVYAAQSGARFVVVGTPSGISLAPEGGQHQSTITPSIGMALPGVTYCEPAYVGALDWLLCDALGRIARGEDRASSYLRLSSRPLDQAPFEAARARYGDRELRRFVLAGAYRLVDAGSGDAPRVHLVGCGAVLPEVVAAAGLLADRGVAAHVVDVTSPDRLYTTWHEPLRHDAGAHRSPRRPALLDALFPGRAPVVTVHDASSHALAWLGSALGVPAVPLGVDSAGQSGSVRELYDLHGLLPDSIAGAALAARAMAREAPLR